jgi:hypothetical protein
MPIMDSGGYVFITRSHHDGRLVVVMVMAEIHGARPNEQVATMSSKYLEVQFVAIAGRS